GFQMYHLMIRKKKFHETLSMMKMLMIKIRAEMTMKLKIVLRRSRQETHISQQGASSTDEGIGSKPGVSDVPSDDSEEEISWNSFDDKDADDQTKGRDDNEGTDLVSSLRTDLDGSSGTDLVSSLRTDLDGSSGTDLVSSLRTDLVGSSGTDLEFWATTYVHQHSIRFKMDTRKNNVDLEAFREMLHISPKVLGQSFDELPFEEEILDFLRFLRHSA
nr:hypothetical protein [Tanacetum cinerariifolium]